MDTKYTILLKDDVKLLEEAIVQFGRIVTFKQLSSLLKNRYTSAQSVRNRISFLLKSGWLIKIKKGFYVIITDLSNLSFNDISGMAITQALNKDSYISFENALQYHGMFDQMLKTVDAVTFKTARKYEMQNLQIRFSKIKSSLFFGFEKRRSDVGIVNIAEREKALLDMLYFRSVSSNIGLIWEKMKEYKEDIDFTRFKEYAGNFGVGIIRKTGFLLDLLEIDTSGLHKSIAGKNGYDRFTKESCKFNAKWRIYFDDKLIN